MKESHKQEVIKTTSNFSFIQNDRQLQIKRTTPVKDGLFSKPDLPKVIDLEENSS